MKSGTAAQAEDLGVGVSGEAYVELIRAIDAERARITAHEAVCAERYKGLDDKLTNLNTGMTEIRKAVSGQGGKMNRWAIGALVAVMGVMLSIIAWEGGQLYQMEPMRLVHGPSSTAP